MSPAELDAFLTEMEPDIRAADRDMREIELLEKKGVTGAGKLAGSWPILYKTDPPPQHTKLRLRNSTASVGCTSKGSHRGRETGCILGTTGRVYYGASYCACKSLYPSMKLETDFYLAGRRPLRAICGLG